VRFGLQYLGWRSTSLGLGELTPGYCGNAFGVKKDGFVAQMETFDSSATSLKATAATRRSPEVASNE